MIQGNILITGGTGTIGHAIAERAKQERWDCSITVLSRDPVKQHKMKRLYPDIRFVVGDVTDYDTTHRTCTGHETVIHAAAMKHIPEGEHYPISMYEVNVMGSYNVAMAAINTGAKRLVAITTDKACYPANAYGCTKKMMEHMYQELALEYPIKVSLPRYGNVMVSTGSVLEFWQKQRELGNPLPLTHPEMTRFWLSPQQAVDHILKSLDVISGYITVPPTKALPLSDMLYWVFGDEVEFVDVGMRPGEKIHETIVTFEEWGRTKIAEGYMCIAPSFQGATREGQTSLMSNNKAIWMSMAEFFDLCEEVGINVGKLA